MTAGICLSSDEVVARFLFPSGKRKPIRPDGSVRPEQFVPYRWIELSVTRHLDWSEDEIWSAGELVASDRKMPLIGRADVLVGVFTAIQLKTVAAPIDTNPNHANVVGWPGEKHLQKEKALLVAAEAKFVPFSDEI